MTRIAEEPRVTNPGLTMFEGTEGQFVVKATKGL